MSEVNPVHEPSLRTSKWIVLNASQTRYLVVQAAAISLGWLVERNPEANCGISLASTDPLIFHDVDLSAHDDRMVRLCRCKGYDCSKTAQVIWIDKSVLSQRVANLNCFQRLNHFPGMHVVARKVMLFKRLMRLREIEQAMRSEAQSLTQTDDPSDGGSASNATRRSTLGTRSSVRPGCLMPTDPAMLSILSTPQPSSPLLFSFFPPSFSLRDDRAKLERHVARNTSRRSHRYIVKPNKGCCGTGILITEDPLSIEVAEKVLGSDTSADAIVQDYVDNPLLIEGKKFDMRIYVFITSVCRGAPPPVNSRHDSERTAETTANSSSAGNENPPDARDSGCGLRVFVHNEGLLRVCVHPYVPFSQSSRAKAMEDTTAIDMASHLTNYAVNKREEDYVAPKINHSNADGQSTIHNDSESHKKGFSFLKDYIDERFGTSLNADGVSPWDALLHRIDECIAATLLSGHIPLQREFKGARAHLGARSDARSCFELLGFDVLLTEKLMPVLMEVNHSPSLFCDTTFDFQVKRKVIADCFRLLEPYIPDARELTTSVALSNKSYRTHQQQRNTPCTKSTDTPQSISPRLDDFEIHLLRSREVNARQIYPFPYSTLDTLPSPPERTEAHERQMHRLRIAEFVSSQLP